MSEKPSPLAELQDRLKEDGLWDPRCPMCERVPPGKYRLCTEHSSEVSARELKLVGELLRKNGNDNT